MSGLKRLIQEIHRRSLWQVLLIYVGAGWVVFEIVQTVTEGLGLPQWFPAFAALLLLIGLPVVLATAFVREGEPAATVSDPTLMPVDEARTEAARRRRFLTWRNAVASFVVALAVWGVVAAGWMLFGRTEDESATAGDRPSVAVLPLVNRSGLEEDEYFTDGIHDEILTQLSKISGLSVRGRTSVMEYRDSPKNLRQIGQDLNARYLLEGGVQRAGETVRVNVQLVDSEADEHVLADTYDRELTVENLLAVQREVALRIAEALEAALTAQEREQIEKAPTDNTEAYDLYLRGREYGRRRGSENRRIAEEMYLKAVELDPDFALAYAALAQHYGWEYFQGWDRTQENADRIRDAAHKAVELDPDLAEAHEAHAEAYFATVLEDQERALEEFAVAQRLSPNCCFRAIGWSQIIRGEWEEGITNLRRAVELNPRDPDLLAYFGGFLVYMRLYDEAILHLDRYVELEPDGGFVWLKALAYLNQPDGAEKALQVRRDVEKAQGGPSPGYNMSGGTVWWYSRLSFRILHDHYRERAREPIPESTTDSSGFFLAKAISYDLDGETVQARAYYDSARVAYEARIEESPERSIPTRIYSALAISYAGLGRAEDAIREATRAVELMPPSNAVSSGQAHIRALAEVYVMVGEYDAAIDRLEYLISIYSPLSPPQLRADPLWDPLRDHPRFQALLEKYDTEQ